MLTIAIPTFRRSEYLVTAINSALNQVESRIDYKILVVNNDPEADMRELELKYGDRVRFHTNEKNLGMLGNINRCIDLTDTKYIAFLHDDDILLPNYVKTVEEFILSDNRFCIIPERYLYSENDNIPIKKRIKINAIEFLRLFNRKNYVNITPEDNIFAWQNCYNAPTCGILFDRESLKKHGKFCFGDTLAWDYLSMLKFNDNEVVGIIKKPLAVYRVSSGVTNKPTTQLDFYNCYEQLLREYAQDIRTRKFISFFHDEIRYLNIVSVCKETRDLINNKDEIHYNKIRYLMLMLHRIFYFSSKDLNVERLPSRKIVKYISEIERL